MGEIWDAARRKAHLNAMDNRTSASKTTSAEEYDYYKYGYSDDDYEEMALGEGMSKFKRKSCNGRYLKTAFPDSVPGNLAIRNLVVYLTAVLVQGSYTGTPPAKVGSLTQQQEQQRLIDVATNAAYRLENPCELKRVFYTGYDGGAQSVAQSFGGRFGGSYSTVEQCGVGYLLENKFGDFDMLAAALPASTVANMEKAAAGYVWNELSISFAAGARNEVHVIFPVVTERYITEEVFKCKVWYSLEGPTIFDAKNAKVFIHFYKPSSLLPPAWPAKGPHSQVDCNTDFWKDDQATQERIRGCDWQRDLSLLATPQHEVTFDEARSQGYLERKCLQLETTGLPPPIDQQCVAISLTS